MAKLSIDAIVRNAIAMVDVSNPDIAPFHQNLELLVDSLNNEAGLRAEAVEGVEQQLAVDLRNRLEVTDWVRRYPEIRDEQIENPLFLTGLPRSGTTYFQYLFDTEPTMRMQRFWEGERACPPPGFAPETIQSRIASAAEHKAVMQAGSEMRAKVAKIHLSDADGPEECLTLLQQTFFDVGKLWSYRVPTYFQRCLDTVDIRAAYEYHKLVLQLLQWRSEPRRWVLKWPCHIVALEEILQVHPDAKFIVTHRDPVQALASNCSLTEMLRRGTAEHVDNHEIGQQMQAMIHTYLQRLTDFDDAHGDRIAHVPYNTAVEQPELAVRQALEKLGMAMSPSFADAIVAWRRDNPPGKRGTHSYSLENYGLDAAAVAHGYRTYIDRFNVAVEHQALA